MTTKLLEFSRSRASSAARSSSYWGASIFAIRRSSGVRWSVQHYQAVVALALLIPFWAGCGGHAEGPETPSAAEQKSDGDKPAINVTACKPIVKQIVEWDEYVARFEAVESAEVRPRVSGLILQTKFIEGQIVKQGDSLFQIDPDPFQAEVTRAEANIDEAVSKELQAQAAVIEAEAAISVAKAAFQLSKKQFDRAQQLAAQNAIAQEDVDVRQSNFDSTTANLEAANAKLASSKAAVTAARSSIDTARAYLQIAQLNLEYTDVKAPIDGRIGQRLVTNGNLVNGGAGNATLLTTIVSIDPIHCYFDADEQAFLKYVRRSASGERASSRDVRNRVFVGLADETGYPHLGQTDFVDNQLDPDTGTMRARAIFRNTDGSLTPGLFARLRLPGSGQYEAVLIPDLAIGTDQSVKFVFVVEQPANIARRTEIEIGPIVQGLRVVRKGLVGTETIVLGGVQRLQNDSKVNFTLEKLTIGSEELPNENKPVDPEDWIQTPRTEAILNGSEKPEPGARPSGELPSKPVENEPPRSPSEPTPPSVNDLPAEETPLMRATDSAPSADGVSAGEVSR